MIALILRWTSPRRRSDDCPNSRQMHGTLPRCPRRPRSSRALARAAAIALLIQEIRAIPPASCPRIQLDRSSCRFGPVRNRTRFRSLSRSGSGPKDSQGSQRSRRRRTSSIRRLGLPSRTFPRDRSSRSWVDLLSRTCPRGTAGTCRPAPKILPRRKSRRPCAQN